MSTEEVITKPQTKKEDVGSGKKNIKSTTNNNIAEELKKRFNEFEKDMKQMFGENPSEEKVIEHFGKGGKYKDMNYKQILESLKGEKDEHLKGIAEWLNKNVRKSTQKQLLNTLDQPTIKKEEQIIEKPIEKATEKPTKIEIKSTPVEKPTEEPTEKATEKPTEKATEKAIEKSTEKKEDKKVEKKVEKKQESGKKKFWDRKVGKLISAPVRIPYDIVTGTGKWVWDGISMNGKKGRNAIKSILKGSKDLVVDNAKWVIDAPKRAWKRTKKPFVKK